MKAGNISLRQRLVLLALVPVLLITIVLGFYVTITRIDHIENDLQNRGKALAMSLVPTAEFGLFSGNENILRASSEAALAEPDVMSVEITDAHRTLVWKSRDPGFPVLLETNGTLLKRFAEPVYRTGVDLSDYKEGDGLEQNREIFGWVVVTMSEEKSIARQHDVLVNSLIIIVGGLILSLLAALRMGQGVAGPLIKLTDVVKRLSTGELNARVDMDSSGELLTLQEGFNAMAESLSEVHDELQKRVDDATQELQATVNELEAKNNELEVARRQALEASKAKSDFLAKMSHEIRTPVNAVLGFSRLLQNSLQEGEGIEQIRIINQAASQLMCIIDDILSFSKLEMGNVTLENIPFDLYENVEDVTCMFAPTVHEKGLELALFIHSDVPRKLKGDPTRVSQVLSNLVNNAVKFTTTGSITVEVSLHETHDDQAAIQIEVVDTGIGISEADQASLFSPFTQADSTITRRFGGTGLGLSIVRRLAELMDGQVGMKSWSGLGSRFWITFKAEVCRDDVEEQASFAGITALIYEKHPLGRRALCDSCLDRNMNIYETGEFESLFETLASSQYMDEKSILLMGLSKEELAPAILLSHVGSVREYYNGPILLLVNEENFKLPFPLMEDEKISAIAKPARQRALYRKFCELLSKATDETYVAKFGEDELSQKLKGVRVLVADDNEFNLLLVSTLLRQRDVIVTEVSSGVEAVNIFDEDLYDLVLMDIHMPEMDGIEASKRIRNKYQQKSVPIVAMTADVFADEENRLMKAGMDAVVLKPITQECLIDTVIRCLGGMVVTVGKVNRQYNDVFERVPAMLLPKLLEELPLHMQRAQQAWNDGSHDDVVHHVHKLNGLVGYFEIGELSTQVKSLEKILREQDYAQAKPLMDEMERKIGSLISQN